MGKRVKTLAILYDKSRFQAHTANSPFCRLNPGEICDPKGGCNEQRA